jgi:hypothetical protein
MWCPSCGAEYRPGFTRCSDCYVDLVVQPPPEPEAERPRRVALEIDLDQLGPAPEVVFVGPPPAADMMRAVLEGSGIDCVVWGSALEHSYGALEPHRVLVREGDAERAGEIIFAARSGELDLDAPPPALGGAFDHEDPDDGWVRPSAAPTQAGPIVEGDAWWARPGWLPAAFSVIRVVAAIAALVTMIFFVFELVEG